MPSDIISYNSINTKLNEIRNDTQSIACAGLFTPLFQAGGMCGGTARNCCYCGIINYPLLSGGTALNVCDTALQLSSGVCCQWTVPAGNTVVQFQIWGGGGGASAAQCLGFFPFGASGAYAVVTIRTAPGCQYTICAGAGGTPTNFTCGVDSGRGCASFVTGFNICGFCADGGLSSLNAVCGQMLCMGSGSGITYGSSEKCIPGFDMACASRGGRICGDGSICINCGCTPTTVIGCVCSGCMPVTFTSSRFSGTNCNPFCSSYGRVFGIPGMMGCGCYSGGGSSCGIIYSPPVVGTTHCFCCSYIMCFGQSTTVTDIRSGCTFVCNLGASGLQCPCANTGLGGPSSTMYGGYATPCGNFLCHPGFGGFASHTFSLSCVSSFSGGTGRAGMVRVTFC